MRTAAIGAVLLISLSLAGCSARHPASSVSSESTAPPVSAPSALPSSDSASDDSLGSIDSSLNTVNGAIQQSQGDLSSGDASAAKDDNQ